MRKLVLLLCAFWLGSPAPGVSQSGTAPAQRPNFLLVLADDLGFSDLGCYGGEIETPNLDRLANQGLRFTHFYNTARCWPSRAALMTGYYAQAVRRDAVPGIQSGGNGKRPAWAPLMSELLQEAGYRTYHSGKWHIDGKPLENGFDHSFEVGKGDNNYFKPWGTTEDGIAVPAHPEYYATTAFADHAIKCLQEHAKEFSHRPFFSYLAFTAPHFPLHAPEPGIAKYREVYRKGWNVIAAERHHRLKKLGIIQNELPAMEREVGPPYHFPDALEILGAGETNRPVPWDELSDQQQRFQAGKMAVHAAMVHRMDQEIGRVIGQIKTMGALENTVIVFLSDNGASAEIMVRGDGHDPAAPPGSAATFLCLGPGWSSAANTPFRRHKTWVHEGGIATPMVLHWPAGIKRAGELRHTPAHIIDIMPTLLELAHVKKPASFRGANVPPAPGRSLLPSFETPMASLHDFLWWQHNGNCAIRQGDWKLVKDAKSDWALYDLSKDRGESRDLVATHPEKARELKNLWEQEARHLEALATSGMPATIERN